MTMEEVPATPIRIVKILWLLLWRGAVMGFLIGAAAGFLLGIIGYAVKAPADTVVLMSRIVGVAAGVVAGFFAVGMLLRKNFSDFDIMLVSPRSLAQNKLQP